jgi:hypothetical protein
MERPVMTDKVIRIGGASGFWGDSSVGAPQLVASGQSTTWCSTTWPS